MLYYNTTSNIMRIYSGSAWENVAVSTSGFATLAGVETLTNKTLTSPKINEDVVVTSTATELNKLDGVTSTTAELNILDGVTSTATELNKLDALSRGSILYGNASAATTILTKGTVDQVLTSDGTDIAWGDASGGVITGSITLYASNTVPSGYLDCDGASVSTTTYASLFSVISYTHGGSGGNFNVPDLRDNYPIGVSGTKAVGTKAGATTATLEIANLASHSHNYSVTNYDAAQANTGAAQARQLAYQSTNATTSSGSGTAIETFPPYIALKFIIKT